MDKEVLIKYLRNQCTANELNEVQRWLNTDWENEEVKTWILSDWNAYRETNNLDDDEQFSAIFDSIQEKIDNKQDDLEKGRNTLTLSVITNWITKAAAILLILTLGYAIASYRLNRENQDAYTVFNIPNAEMGNVMLPDGTKVKLNSSSELRYRPRFLKSREVYLRGEAFFDVVSDAKHPFLVHVDDFTVKVTGTKFNVTSYPETNPEATLEQGKITIIDKEGKNLAELKPNENLVLDKMQNRIWVTTIDTRLKTDWREGKIFMKNQTIEEMSKIIERWYNVKIVFDDESIKQVRLTGTILRNKPFEQLLNVLKISEPIDFKYIKEINGSNVIHVTYKTIQ